MMQMAAKEGGFVQSAIRPLRRCPSSQIQRAWTDFCAVGAGKKGDSLSRGKRRFNVPGKFAFSGICRSDPWSERLSVAP